MGKSSEQRGEWHEMRGEREMAESHPIRERRHQKGAVGSVFMMRESVQVEMWASLRDRLDVPD